VKILLTGGSGLLGQELLKLDNNIVAPPHEKMDILDIDSCRKIIKNHNPDVILHAAAYTSPPRCDKNPELARQINIIGTCNLITICEESGIRLIYISTDYVFDGKKGNYCPTDPINPVNKYAMTKAAGELAAMTYEYSLIIRTSFCENVFPYEKAFVDQYTSRDYVDIIAPLILKAVLSGLKGIIHIGTGKKSVFELARRRKPEVRELSTSDVDFVVPKDTSFDS